MLLQINFKILYNNNKNKNNIISIGRQVPIYILQALNTYILYIMYLYTV